MLAAHDARFVDELEDEGHVLRTTMLIVLGLCIKGMTVERSSETFKSLTKTFFAGQQKPSTLTEHCHRIMKCAVYGGIYEVHDLEAVFIALFGDVTLMIESISGAKVAVTAISDGLPSTRLFVN